MNPRIHVFIQVQGRHIEQPYILIYLPYYLYYCTYLNSQNVKSTILQRFSKQFEHFLQIPVQSPEIRRVKPSSAFLPIYLKIKLF